MFQYKGKLISGWRSTDPFTLLLGSQHDLSSRLQCICAVSLRPFPQRHQSLRPLSSNSFTVRTMSGCSLSDHSIWSHPEPVSCIPGRLYRISTSCGCSLAINILLTENDVNNCYCCQYKRLHNQSQSARHLFTPVPIHV